MNINSTNGAVFCTELNGNGLSRDIEIDQINTFKPELGVIWLHLDYEDGVTKAWLKNESGLSPLTCDVLLTDETRLRVASADRGMLITWRGVNCNPGADPDDMVFIKL